MFFGLIEPRQLNFGTDSIVFLRCSQKMDVVTKLTIFLVTVPLTRKYWSWSKATRMSNTVSPPSPQGHYKDITFVKYSFPPPLSLSRVHCKYITFDQYCTECTGPPLPFLPWGPGATEITILWPNNETLAHNSARHQNSVEQKNRDENSVRERFIKRKHTIQMLVLLLHVHTS